MENFPPPLDASPVSRPPVHPARGWALVVTGTGLSACMAYLAYAAHDMILHNGEPGVRSHWHGDAAFNRLVFELFGSIFFLGLTAVAAGIYALWKRRISRVLAAVMILLGLVTAYFVWAIIQTDAPR